MEGKKETGRREKKGEQHQGPATQLATEQVGKIYRIKEGKKLRGKM